MEICVPPELRALCFQLSSIPPVELPRHISTFQRLVLACRVPLSCAADTYGQIPNSGSSSALVLAHKLKTQLTTLLYGKIPEGRFAAAVLIKSVIEIGGWEVLRASEPWVRGLLSVLGKSDSPAVKEVCIITLTKIYCLTHRHQTLLREITTPTLPSFLSSCISVISAKSSSFALVPSLSETVLRSFALLIPRHNAIFRPFASQIRTLIRPWLAPTLSSNLFTPSALKDAARTLLVVFHQTAAKNAGGEEWGKAVRELVKDIHLTADQVFRAVVEDWESNSGYTASTVDVNVAPTGGGRSVDDLPSWSGIDPGLERLTGLLQTLSDYFKHETSTSVSIPLGAIVDLTARVLSISAPSLPDSGYGYSRINPAIDRDERERLWAELPCIHVEVLALLCVIDERLQENFLPLALSVLDQLIWAFKNGKDQPEFRIAAYNLTARLLRHVGKSLSRTQTLKLAPIMRACCASLPSSIATNTDNESLDSGGNILTSHAKDSNHTAKSLVNSNGSAFYGNHLAELDSAIHDLLPLFFSHLPQHHLDVALRSQLERYSILTHNHDAMLASIMHPFVGKNGRALTSLLPHIGRDIPNDSRVECLLRPRMPVLPWDTGRHDAGSNEPMDIDLDVDETVVGNIVDELAVHKRFDSLHNYLSSERDDSSIKPVTVPGLGLSSPKAQPPKFIGSGPADSNLDSPLQQTRSNPNTEISTSHISSSVASRNDLENKNILEGPPFGALPVPGAPPAHATVATLSEPSDSSDDESVHLTMAMETDSEDED